MSDLLNKASLVMVPSGYKEDTVYSVVPSDGSGDLSFTRASNGTRVNSAGLVEVTPWNLLEQSETIGVSPWGVSGYTQTTNATTAPNGTNTAELFTLNNGNVAGPSYSILQALVLSGEITISVYFKNNNSTGKYVLQTGAGQGSEINVVTLAITNFAGCVGSVENVGNGWYRFSTFIPSASNPYFFSYQDGMTGDGSKGIYLWGAQVNFGTLKPYFPTTDRLNVPRLTYQNGGGGCPSLLLEKQSTNGLYPSEDFSTTWLLFNSATVTTNQATSPNGTQNADKLTTTNQGTAIYNVNGAGASAQAYTASLFIKYIDNTEFAIGMTDDVTGEAFARFNFTTGTATTTLQGDWTSISYAWEQQANGWYRISVTATKGASGNARFIGKGGGAYNYYIWGAQVEASSYKTSYIPTTSSSATRVADLSTTDTIQTAQTFAGDFTFFVDFVSFTTTDALGPTNQMLIGGGNQALGATYKSYFWITQQSVQLTGDSETTIIASTKTFNANQRYKLLVKRNGTTVKIFCDGVQVGASATSSLSITIRSIGWSYSNNYRFNGLINQVVLSATGFSDADCQALTTL